QERRGSMREGAPSTARLCFWGFCYQEAAGPHEALAQLHELCLQWLRPDVCSKKQMLELLVLEQFLGALPLEIQAWVGAQCPQSGEEAAVLVAELTQTPDRRGKGSVGAPHGLVLTLASPSSHTVLSSSVLMANDPQPHSETRSLLPEEPGRPDDSRWGEWMCQASSRRRVVGRKNMEFGFRRAPEAC
uniref:SCAN box domain-containing protein n=1 Tax=Rhinolophus ferrumequinum TaxID=59479 RepID=A0A671ECU2_RHIFE